MIFFSIYDHPINLALFRMIFFGTCLLYFIISPESFNQLYEPWIDLPEKVRSSLPPFGDIFSILPLTETVIFYVKIIWWATLISSFIGLFTNLSILLWTISTFYIFGIPQYYGEVNHYHFLIWFSLLLAVSPCNHSLSFDLFLKKAFNFNFSNKLSIEKAYPFSYSLPIFFIAMLLGIIYFFPGFWKIWYNGLDWALSDNIKNLMLSKTLEVENWRPIFPLHNYPLLYKTCGVFILVFEILFIYLIFSSKGRKVALLSGIIFHVSTYLFMHINFLPLLGSYSCLINFKNPQQKSTKNAGTLSYAPSLSKLFHSQKTIFSVGSLLLIANFVFGALKITDGWPFACFPTFHSKKAPIEEHLAYFGSSGKAERIKRNDVASFYTLSRYKSIEDKILEASRSGKLLGTNPYLSSILTQLDKSQNLDSLYIYIETIRFLDKKDSIVNSELIYSHVFTNRNGVK